MTKRDARSDQGWSLTRFLVHIEGPNVLARFQWLTGPTFDAASTATVLDTYKPVQAAENSEQTFQSPIVQCTLRCLLLHGFQLQ